MSENETEGMSLNGPQLTDDMVYMAAIALLRDGVGCTLNEADTLWHEWLGRVKHEAWAEGQAEGYQAGLNDRDPVDNPYASQDHDDRPESDTNRVVTFPPVVSFGRLERDKWLPLKNLEESAELVEASKRWLKTNSDTDRTDMLSELADVIQTLANLIVAFDITDQELTDALQECRERNRKKGRL